MTGLLVVLSGGVGAGVRFIIGSWLQRTSRSELPVGTALVNLSGAAALGLTVGVGVEGDALVAIAGFLAGYTTYSTWMVESVGLAREGSSGAWWGAVNLAGLMLTGLAVATVGVAVGRWIV